MTELYGWITSNGFNPIDDISCVTSTTYDDVRSTLEGSGPLNQCSYRIQEASQRMGTSKHDERTRPHALDHVSHYLALMLAARSDH